MPNIKFTEMPDVGSGLDPDAIVPLVQTLTNYTITAANLQAYINTTTGDMTAANFIGDGSQLTSLTAANIVGTVANATYATSAGSATTATSATTADTANVAYSVAAANIVGTVANAAYATNANAANFATTATSAGTATYVTAAAQANITSVGALTSLTVTGNATIGNVGTTSLTASGNVTGSYILGNGSLLTGLPATYGNANVSNFLASGTNAANIVTTANIAGTYFIGNGSQLTGITASGSTYGNSNVVSLLSSYGSNTISTTGNITAGNFVGNGAALTGIVASSGSYIVSGNNYANVAAANGKVVINTAGVSNVAMINAAPANSLMMFNDLGNAYIRLDATGNIYIGNNPLTAKWTHILQPVLANYIEFTDNALPGSNANISGQTLTWGRGTTANFNGIMKVPVYTVAAKPTVGQFTGHVISISDSPTNNGKLAYWCNNNARWQYVNGDTPV